MSKDLQASAERYMFRINRAASRVEKHLGTIIVRGDRLTEYHNANFDTEGRSDDIKDRIVHMVDVAKFAISSAVHYPSVLLHGGMMLLAARPFERVLQQQRPDILQAVHGEEIDHYDAAEHILGFQGALTIESSE